MTVYGAGATPCGTAPAGLPYDSFAPTTFGATQLSVAYDVLSRGYKVDDTTGQLAQMGGVMQRVALILVNRLRSATAQPSFGIRPPVVHSSTFAEDREAAVKDALRPLLDDGTIRIESITTETSGSRSRTSVTFKNLQTGQSQAVLV